MKVDWLALCLRILEASMAVVILGMIARIDTQISQARVKYIVAVGAIGTALCGVYGIPMEFVHFRYNRWILALIDCLAWMLLIAAAIIAADDIHTCRAVQHLGAVSAETCRLVKAATGFAFAGTFFALVLFIYEAYLIGTKQDYDSGYPSTFHHSQPTPATTPEKHEQA